MIFLFLSIELGSLLNEIDWIYQESYKEPSLFIKASDILDSLYKIYSENAEILWRKSYFCFIKGDEAGKKEEKMKFFQDGQMYGKYGIKADSLNPDVHYWYAVNKAKEGELRGVLNSLFMVDELKKEANLVLKLNPKHAGSNVLLGSIYKALPSFAGGNKEKAIEYLNQAIANDSGYSSAYLTLAEVFIEKKKYEVARKILNLLIDLRSPRDKRFYYLKDRKKGEELLKKIEGK